MVFDCSPVSGYEVSVFPVFLTMVVHVESSVDCWMRYPVIGEPPSLEDALQFRSISEDDTAVAVRFVGCDGMVAYTAVIDWSEDADMVRLTFVDPVSAQWLNLYLP